MSRLGKTEKTIFSIALLMLLAFSYFLYDDSLLFPKDRNGQLELIGSVAVSQNDVRRKNLDTFSWRPASREDSIYENDSIFTGERSEAQIRLQDGTIIRIQPNSLITLKMKNGQMSLDLRYGNLIGEIAQGSTLKIHSGGEEFNLDSSEKSKVQFKKAHTGNVDLQLLSGKINYSDKKKQAQLVKDTPVAISPKGEIKQLQKPTVELKTANNTTWMRINPDDPLPLEWIGHGDISNYDVEISATPDFKNVTVSKSTPEMKLPMTEPLEPGSYFWRVKAYDRNGETALSEVRQMGVTHLAGPEITSPQKQAEFQMEMRVKSPEDLALATEIKWQAPPILKVFKWQVSKEERFNEVLKEGTVNGLNALTPKLPSGTYWVRVAGATEDNKVSPWSAPVSFSLNLTAKKELERPARPELVAKDIKFKLPRTGERRPASEMAPKLEWKPVVQTKLYHVQVSKDMDFKNAKRYDVPTTSTLWSQVQPGQFYYRVYARGDNGVLSLPSDIGSILVDAPIIKQNIALVTPKLMEPYNNTSIFLQTEQEPFIWLEWRKVSGATNYTVEISDKEDFSNTIISTNSDKNRFLIKNRIPLGKLYWRVRAEAKDSDDKSEWTEKREFTIYHQKNETFVK
ncbi:MAG: FecR domain-containing protein [Bdellovibrio sp.]|nr:FecR domain-containing protein [Bdellovibrio sp.]